MTQYQVCAGAAFEAGKNLWNDIPNSYIDLNPYLESSYVSTCRATNCNLLIPLRLGSSRCQSCSKILRSLKGRYKTSNESEYNENTRNDLLSKSQTKAKLKDKQEKNRAAQKRNKYLEKKIKKMEEMLDKEGVDLEENLSIEFSNILQTAPLSEMQQLFLDQQMKYAAVKDKRQHRWHPAMIRLAIKIRNTSAAAYEIMRDSGAVNLPHSGTLFDYTHSIEAQVGVNSGLVEMFSKQVKQLSVEESRELYHVLIFDEMYISQNLVYRKSDGALIGYAHYDDTDKEVQRFEAYFEGNIKEPKPDMAVTMLGFMVKGITSNQKCVVAAYPCKSLNKFMIYSRAWEVVSHCEGAGIKILAMVCDGGANNRSFFKLHTPIHRTESGIVYDTPNMYAGEERPMFFISDVAHLLKCIRNCLYNSREGAGDQYRRMERNGQPLLWKVIVKLYYEFKGDTLREGFKLNAQNVFPNSYSVMRVKYAAQVLSQTVANLLKELKWENTEELIEFIEKMNKFFDVMNGAHSSQSKSTKQLNPDLAPYTDPGDERLKWLLEDFWENYILHWKNDNDKKFAGLDA
ncbi:Transposable element P transposase [Frankliniella fusca]|uniref:Transposable element P transposase n=1 Tax=Frankliniella fusca TaxID=407009 RepID=A0AAE1HP78_9NEOP|nr:Transposable element P transposase [Frankliniella fusca]KAK3924788.1 Transposable element P transposase [Frankliniella fusca]KAK3929216.1 Transposable element P transposase [Frankliniella fusca]KAK3931391.1 Transposable element P transposase [Frankliniella fusca]